MRDQNKDLLDKVNSQNEKIENLEKDLKDHADRIQKCKIPY